MGPDLCRHISLYADSFIYADGHLQHVDTSYTDGSTPVAHLYVDSIFPSADGLRPSAYLLFPVVNMIGALDDSRWVWRGKHEERKAKGLRHMSRKFKTSAPHRPPLDLKVDDVVIFVKPAVHDLIAVRELLAFFGAVSGLMVNFPENLSDTDHTAGEGR
jgi:hypothetical protein